MANKKNCVARCSVCVGMTCEVALPGDIPAVGMQTTNPTKQYGNRLVPWISNRERHMRGAKQRYTSEESANIAKKAMSKKDRTSEFRVYQCPYCQFWHLGTNRHQITR